MSDSIDSASPTEPDRVEQFFVALRSALTSDASPEARSSAAVACRALLGVLDPPTHRNEPPPPASSGGGILGVVKTMPREQLVELAAGMLRSFFVAKTPVYRSAPPRAVSGASEGRE